MFVYVLSANLLSRIKCVGTVINCDEKFEIFAFSNGVHTDLVFKTNDVKESLSSYLNLQSNFEYLAIGWGDKGFYIHTPSWSELKISTALNAAFLPSATLMHLTYYGKKLDSWKAIFICKEQLDSLLKFIISSFKQDTNNKFKILHGAGFTTKDFFYEAHGQYTCFYTCNVWVNQALKKARVTTALWAPFESGIMRHL